MTKKQFKHSFFRGLGSAIIELEHCHDKVKYRDIVLYACLHNTTYDMQCEGNRSFYLFNAIKLLGDMNAFEHAIIERFKSVRNDIWLFEQLTSLLFMFAKSGSENAQNALYEEYELLLHKIETKRKSQAIYDEEDMFEWLSVWLMKLNGFDAFKKIVIDYGRNIADGKAGCFSCNWFYTNAKNTLGKRRIENYLSKQADESIYVSAFYESVKSIEERPYKDTPIPTLEKVIKNAYIIRDGTVYHGRGAAMRFARNASEDDLNKLAMVALNEPDLNIKAELLWAFREVRFKFSDEILHSLLHSENEDIQDTALHIMGQNPSKKAHDFALSLISEEKETENGIELLCKNFRKEDEELLFDAIKTIRITRTSGWHKAFMAVESAFEKGCWKPKTNILEYLYQNTLCSCCRFNIVKLMNKHNALTRQILNECIYDSYIVIRVFAERKLNSINKITKNSYP